MRKLLLVAIAQLFILAGLYPALPAKEARGEVSVNVNVGPPPIAVAEPPEVVLVPGSRVYYVPEVPYDVFYYSGYWWSPRGDRWYRARAYDGPWRVVSRRVVPSPVYRVPRDYRQVYVRERHIPYGQWKKEHYGGGREWGEHRGRGHGHGNRGEHRGWD